MQWEGAGSMIYKDVVDFVRQNINPQMNWACVGYVVEYFQIYFKASTSSNSVGFHSRGGLLRFQLPTQRSHLMCLSM